MSASVLVIWLDSAEPTFVEAMMAAGELPHLARLRQRGIYGRLKAPAFSLPETAYGMVLTGQPPQLTGCGLVGNFDPSSYTMSSDGMLEHPGVPFFVPCDRHYRIAAFDVPQFPMLPDLNGLQVAAWGAHSPQVPPRSLPRELMDELVARHGRHPAGPGCDHACLDDATAMKDLYERLLRGIELRGEVTCDLLGREHWDLFFTTFGETHVAGHMFWPHPACRDALGVIGGSDAIRAVYRAADRLLGRTVETAGPDARCLVFSPKGMQDNCADHASIVFLPEYLFRYSFPGLVGLDFSDPDLPPSPESQAGIRDWVMELWHRRHRSSRFAATVARKLPDSWALRLCRGFRQSPPLAHPSTRSFWGWQPTMWYQPYWPHMKAFALVSNSDGFIRLNVRGRERHGRIAAHHYDHTCAEITAWLHELRDPGTGRPAVERVLRMRSAPDEGQGIPHGADLVVQWSSTLSNRIDSPRFGRLGPVPYHRTGAHSSHGFLCASGPGIPVGQTRATGSLLDIAPTILTLMGASCPRELPGKSLVAVRAMRSAA